MDKLIRLDDINAPELDVYARLTQAQLKSRQHPEKGLFIAEGTKVIELALAAGIKPVSFLVEERHVEGKAKYLLEAHPDVPIYTAESSVLKMLTGYELTRGVLCAMHRPQGTGLTDICASASRLAIIEDVVDASNLGAIFRCAAALGMDGIILSPSCCDPLYRKAVRTSMGTVFQIPWTRLSCPWPTVGMSVIKDYGFTTAALALKETALSIEDTALANLDKLAVILGTEGSGLCDETIELSDKCVYIPMSGGVDSLNVAAAAAVAFWQLRKRQ